MLRPPPSSLFPYTTLFRSRHHVPHFALAHQSLRRCGPAGLGRSARGGGAEGGREDGRQGAGEDRKSTRLNSSHLGISYAVFCLKKKKHTSKLQPPLYRVYR